MILRWKYLSCALLFGSVGFLTGCESKVSTTTLPLIDSRHAAEVLVERSVLSNPRSVDGNRLLRGWRYVRDSSGLKLTPIGSQSVVEFINLKERDREIEVTMTASNAQASIRARIGDRDLGVFSTFNGTITIPLPEDLPLGRVAVTLEAPDAGDLGIKRVAVSPCLRLGTVIFEDDRISQTGWSSIELVHEVRPGARLVVDFLPPSEALPRQRFAITLDHGEGNPREVFSWAAKDGVENPDPLSVSALMGAEAGFVRIRLIAEGRGPAAGWIAPQIIESAPPPVEHSSGVSAESPRIVVLYVMDALRADHVGHHGTIPGLTPVLDRIASEGVSFTNHFAVAPNTPPSTRALFSGRCLLDDRQLPHPGPTRLAEVYREAGYRTVSITGNPHLSSALDLGTGFESVEMLRVPENHNPKHPATVNNSAEILHEAAIRWIDELGPDERAFLYIHSMNPHNPYTPPPELADRFAPPGPSTIDGRTRTLVAIRDLQRDVDSDDVDRLRGLYAAGVAYNDGELGVLLDQIDHRFSPEQVFVAVTSDHGEELLEHNGVLHGFSLYDEMLRIPLIVRWLGHLGSEKIGVLTNTLDLHASMVELAGGDARGSTGSSVWPLMNDGRSAVPGARVTFAAAPGLAGAVMARTDRWKLIRVPRNGLDRGMGKGRGRSWDVEYAFDLANDPDERHNLAGTDELEVAWLRSRLTAWLANQLELQPAPGDQVMDDETKDQLEALGYIVEP